MPVCVKLASSKDVDSWTLKPFFPSQSEHPVHEIASKYSTWHTTIIQVINFVITHVTTY